MSEKELYDIVAGNIVNLLKWNDKTQADLAKYMGVSQTAVSNWCQGNKMPRMDKIDKICDFFGVNRSELFNGLTHEYLISKRRTQKLMDLWQKLNPEGQNEGLTYLEYLTKNSKYAAAFPEAEEDLA